MMFRLTSLLGALRIPAENQRRRGPSGSTVVAVLQWTGPAGVENFWLSAGVRAPDGGAWLLGTEDADAQSHAGPNQGVVAMTRA